MRRVAEEFESDQGGRSGYLRRPTASSMGRAESMLTLDEKAQGDIIQAQQFPLLLCRMLLGDIDRGSAHIER